LVFQKRFPRAPQTAGKERNEESERKAERKNKGGKRAKGMKGRCISLLILLLYVLVSWPVSARSIGIIPNFTCLQKRV
jgi:hypothetical protein